MNTELSNSLGGFASSVNSLIPVTTILTVLGIALGSAFSIYILVWGAKQIVKTVVGAINGDLSIDEADYTHYGEHENLYKGYFENMSTYTDYYDNEDKWDAITYGYNSPQEYYRDKLIANKVRDGDFSAIQNEKYRYYLEHMYDPRNVGDD